MGIHSRLIRGSGCEGLDWLFCQIFGCHGNCCPARPREQVRNTDNHPRQIEYRLRQQERGVRDREVELEHDEGDEGNEQREASEAAHRALYSDENGREQERGNDGEVDRAVDRDNEVHDILVHEQGEELEEQLAEEEDEGEHEKADRRPELAPGQGEEHEADYQDQHRDSAEDPDDQAGHRQGGHDISGPGRVAGNSELREDDERREQTSDDEQGAPGDALVSSMNHAANLRASGAQSVRCVPRREKQPHLDPIDHLSCQNHPMAIEFGSSPRSDIGIEWELECVDHTSGELSPAAPEILAALAGDDDSFPQITKELLTNTVEIVSGPHDRVKDAVADLTGMIDRVREVTDPMGVDLMCSGTHPFSQWFQQHVSPGSERYATLIDRTQWWGRQLMIWGVHMHVGIDDRAKVLPIVNGLLSYYPHFQALSASSPFWVGEATGYASSRAMLFQQLPTAGLPPQLTQWESYEEYVDDLTHVGVIDDYSELRWDVRPSPKWGTVELRFCDGLPTVEEVASVSALAQCLVEEMSTRLDNGEQIETMQPWFVRENKWRAARYGMEAIIITNSKGDETLVKDDTVALLARLEPIAERLGCTDELNGITTILDRGASYQRQLGVAADNGGSLKAVVASLVSELRDGVGGR